MGSSNLPAVRDDIELSLDFIRDPVTVAIFEGRSELLHVQTHHTASRLTYHEVYKRGAHNFCVSEGR